MLQIARYSPVVDPVWAAKRALPEIAVMGILGVNY